MSRSHLSQRGRGGSFGPFLSGLGNHPVCAVSERDLLLSGAATPPNLGGKLCSLQPYILQKSSYDLVKLLRLLRVTQMTSLGNHLQPRSGRHFIPHWGYLILGAPDQ